MFMRFFSSMRPKGLRATPCSKIILSGFQCYRTKAIKDEQEDSVPQSIDWRDKGFSSKVFNQGSCGCCWAASAVASIESHYKLLTGKVVSLSIQEIIDFDTANSGCRGGLPYLALQYAMYNGLASEDDYPHYGCHPEHHKLKGRRKLLMGLGNKLVRKKVLAIDGVGFVTPYCEDQLLKAVARQPVCVGIYAGKRFVLYEGLGLFGLFSPCPPNHAVVIVGYGSDCRGQYWIVRNSWGVEWCVEGHIYFERNTGDPSGVANINSVPCYPVILEGKEEETMSQDLLISENKNAEGIYSLRVLEGAENTNQDIDSLVSARFLDYILKKEIQSSMSIDTNSIHGGKEDIKNSSTNDHELRLKS